MGTLNKLTLPDITNSNLDPRQLQALSRFGKKDSPQSEEALTKVAKQFEAIFVQQMLKTMREAGQGEGIFDNDQTKLYQSLQDEQLSQKLTEKKGFGIADAIVRQLKTQQAHSVTTTSVDSISLHPLNGINYQRKPTGYSDTLLPTKLGKNNGADHALKPLQSSSAPLLTVMPTKQMQGVANGN